MKLTYEIKLKLHPLQIRKDQRHYIVEDQVTGEFFEMPVICIAALEMINGGLDLSNIEQKLKAEYPQEEVDVLDFVQQLLEMGLVAEIDGEKIETVTKKETAGFTWIPQQFARILFNRFTYLFFAIFIFINTAIFVTNPSLFPRYQDLFVFDVMVFNVLLYMGISFIFVLVHEFGHVLAMRAQGLPTKVEIGHRLFLVVFETDMSPAWGLTPKKRSLLFLAGMYFDAWVMFVALLINVFYPELPRLAQGVTGIIIFDSLIRIAYQFCIYMKTDLYYLFENVTGAYNLLENARTYFKRKILTNKAPAEEVIFSEEKPMIVFYGVFYILGMTVTLALLIFYFIPQTMYLLKHSLPSLSLPVSTLQFWDGAIIFIQLFLMLGMLFYSWMKKYKLKN